eukprot:9147117-Karenia_brevis.AAC.1
MLARLGSSGAHPANCRRDLTRRLGMENSFFPAPVEVKTLLVNKKTVPPEIREGSIWMFLGQDILNAFYCADPDALHVRFGTKNAPEFWANCAADDPRLQDHPMC